MYTTHLPQTQNSSLPDNKLGHAFIGLPWWLRWQRICLQCKRTGFDLLGWEGPLEKEMTTHSNILAWRIPWTDEPGGLQSMGLQRVRLLTERLTL